MSSWSKPARRAGTRRSFPRHRPRRAHRRSDHRVQDARSARAWSPAASSQRKVGDQHLVVPDVKSAPCPAAPCGCAMPSSSFSASSGAISLTRGPALWPARPVGDLAHRDIEALALADAERKFGRDHAGLADDAHRDRHVARTAARNLDRMIVDRRDLVARDRSDSARSTTSCVPARDEDRARCPTGVFADQSSSSSSGSKVADRVGRGLDLERVHRHPRGVEAGIGDRVYRQIALRQFVGCPRPGAVGDRRAGELDLRDHALMLAHHQRRQRTARAGRSRGLRQIRIDRLFVDQAPNIRNPVAAAPPA